MDGAPMGGTDRPVGRRRIAGLLCAALAVTLAPAGCGEQSGDVEARAQAVAEAKRLNQALGHRDRPRDAASITATEVLGDSGTPAPGDGSTVRREAMAWTGRVSGDERATIDVRFVVTLDERPVTSFGARGRTAGAATVCFRYELRLYRYTSYQEIDCPSGAAPPTPSAAPVPALPADGRKRLTAVLRSARPETLAGAVRTAFPQEWITVDTAAQDGALVAAVGVPAERECLLLVRTPTGRIEEPGYDRIWLEPGETGCRTGLYLSPPR
ncbi:hypothetical protein [Micromonospora maritima]|uniref:Lipoprotein n=1 Tax=Micromonospora maritima TaxID=986711 RepID=A0ABW7ZJ63_9ACTN